MKPTKYYLLIGASAVIITTFSVASLSLAQENGSSNQNAPKQAMVQALDENDYQAWKDSLPGKAGKNFDLSEENFAKLVEAHNLMKEGRFEEARAIQEELGMPGMRGQGHKGPQLMISFLEENDFEAWKKFFLEKGIADSLLTLENFNKMSDVHNLMQEGKTEEAKALREEIPEELNLPPRAEKMGAMKQILEDQNFEEWKKLLMEKGVDESKLTEGNFALMVEAHTMMQNGDFQEAKKLMDQADIGPKFRPDKPWQNNNCQRPANSNQPHYQNHKFWPRTGHKAASSSTN